MRLKNASMICVVPRKAVPESNVIDDTLSIPSLPFSDMILARIDNGSAIYAIAADGLRCFPSTDPESEFCSIATSEGCVKISLYRQHLYLADLTDLSKAEPLIKSNHCATSAYPPLASFRPTSMSFAGPFLGFCDSVSKQVYLSRYSSFMRVGSSLMDPIGGHHRDGLFHEAIFTHPLQIIASNQKRHLFYVLEPTRIRLISERRVSTLFVQLDECSAKLLQGWPQNLCSMAVDCHGRLFVADSATKSLVMIQNGVGTILRSPYHGPTSNTSPLHISLSSHGEIIVLDSDGGLINVTTPQYAPQPAPYNISTIHHLPPDIWEVILQQLPLSDILRLNCVLPSVLRPGSTRHITHLVLDHNPATQTHRILSDWIYAFPELKSLSIRSNMLAYISTLTSNDTLSSPLPLTSLTLDARFSTEMNTMLEDAFAWMPNLLILELPWLLSVPSTFPTSLPPKLTHLSLPRLLSPFQLCELPETLQYLDLIQCPLNFLNFEIPPTAVPADRTVRQQLQKDAEQASNTSFTTLLPNLHTLYALQMQATSAQHRLDLLPRNLTELDIRRIAIAHPRSWQHLPPKLKSLTVNCAYSGQDCILPASLTSLHAPSSIALSNAFVAQLSCSEHLCYGLRRLILPKSQYILITALPHISKFRALEHLVLPSNFWRSLWKDDISALPRSLTHLDLSANITLEVPEATDSSFNIQMSDWLPPSLQFLSLGNRFQVSAQHLQRLPRTLKSLHLPQCVDISLEGLAALRTNCPELTNLDIPSAKIPPSILIDLSPSFRDIGLPPSIIESLSSVTIWLISKFHITSFLQSSPNHIGIESNAFFWLPRSLTSLKLQKLTSINPIHLVDLPEQLSLLHLPRVQNLRDQDLLEYGLPRYLKELDISSSPYVTSMGLSNLLQLSTVYLGCTFDSLSEIASQQPCANGDPIELLCHLPSNITNLRINPQLHTYVGPHLLFERNQKLRTLSI